MATSAYIEALKQRTSSATAAPSLGLRDRFIRWHNSLPPVSRDRPFSMSEIEAALGTQGRHISAVLCELGWKRKRVWSGQHYYRYWTPGRVRQQV